MTKNESIITNLSIYLAIAKDSMDKSDEIAKANTRPKPNGEPGSIITFDPEQGSFKHSLIAIVFAGIYLDALIHIEGVKRLGKKKYRKIDRKMYEEKLAVLFDADTSKVDDSDIIETCERFRKARNEVVHEKPIKLADIQKADIRFAQEEARRAIDLVERITDRLSPKP